MAMLALYQVLLAKHCAQRDFVIGTSVANRDARGVEDVVGNFVNMVAMRSRLAGNPSFRELLSRSRETALEAFASQNVPFGDIVKALALPALRHRIQLRAEAEMEGVTTESVIGGVLRTVAVPR